MDIMDTIGDLFSVKVDGQADVLCRHAGARDHFRGKPPLPDDLKTSRYPEIRWRAIHGAGNVYRPWYGKVSKADIWDTAVRQLEGLGAIVGEELDGSELLNPAAPRGTNIDEGSNE